MWKAEVRLLDAPYSFDRPWSYLSESRPEIGMIASIPFGKSDRYRYGAVTAVSEYGGEELKKIDFYLPLPYKLSEHHVELAHFMCDRCFCSFGDAARVMLPSGLNFKIAEYYEKGESFFETDFTSNGELLKIYDELKDSPRHSLDGIDKGTVSRLLKKGVIVKKTEALVSVNEKCETVAAVKKKFSDSELQALLKGCRKKSEYLEIIKYLDGAGEPVSISSLYEIYQVGREGFKFLEKRGIVTLCERRVERKAYTPESFEEKKEALCLSEQQEKARATLVSLMDSPDPSAALLYGVTGSGKTSVILSVVDKALEDNKGVIILVPEIALTLQNASVLFSRYRDRVAVIHSGMSEGQRQDAWEELESGRKTVVLGTRSAVFAPVKNLGVIVIDEEQDSSFKSDVTPRYHARDIARFRCAKNGALMLLSSATPDVESFWRAQNGKYTLVKLTERFGGATLPDITIYDTVSEGLAPDCMIGSELEDKLHQTLKKGEQAILFLNRRGLRKLLVCRDCKSGVSCPNCSVPMTLHLSMREYRLVCHYCGYTESPPMKCPNCSSAHLQYRGFGTEKLEEELRRKIPEARVIRMDADTTSRKNSHDEIIKKFANHEADILIGTQMVTKGHNFPDVTLVGVVMADLSLMVSDYKAAEHTFSLLTQVVGRAGRSKKKGSAVIQTSDSSGEIINLCTTQDYEGFYNGEIALRRSLTFPPFCTVGMFFLTSDSEGALETASDKLDRLLSEKLSGEFSDVKIIAYGPFEAFPYKLKNKYRRKLVVKYADRARTRELFRSVLSEFSQKDRVNCIFDSSPSGI